MNILQNFLNSGLKIGVIMKGFNYKVLQITKKYLNFFFRENFDNEVYI